MNDLYRERASAGEGERDRRASRRLRGRVFKPFLCSASAVYMLNNFGAPGSVYVYVCMCVCGVCVCVRLERPSRPPPSACAGAFSVYPCVHVLDARRTK